MTQETAENITNYYLAASNVQAEIRWDLSGGWAGGHTTWTGDTITFPCEDLQLPEELFRFVAAHEVGHVVYATESCMLDLA